MMLRAHFSVQASGGGSGEEEQKGPAPSSAAAAAAAVAVPTPTSANRRALKVEVSAAPRRRSSSHPLNLNIVADKVVAPAAASPPLRPASPTGPAVGSGGAGERTHLLRAHDSAPASASPRHLQVDKAPGGSSSSPATPRRMGPPSTTGRSAGDVRSWPARKCLRKFTDSPGCAGTVAGLAGHTKCRSAKLQRPSTHAHKAGPLCVRAVAIGGNELACQGMDRLRRFRYAVLITTTLVTFAAVAVVITDSVQPWAALFVARCSICVALPDQVLIRRSKERHNDVLALGTGAEMTMQLVLRTQMLFLAARHALNMSAAQEVATRAEVLSFATKIDAVDAAAFRVAASGEPPALWRGALSEGAQPCTACCVLRDRHVSAAVHYALPAHGPHGRRRLDHVAQVPVGHQPGIHLRRAANGPRAPGGPAQQQARLLRAAQRTRQRACSLRSAR